MILIKSAIPSILVVLGACDRAASESSAAARIDAGPSVASADASMPVTAKVVGPSPVAAKTLYVCPMHPEVVSETPGLCPKCNMKLDPKPQVTESRRGDERANAPDWP